MSATFLNIDSAAAWDSALPVTLPYGSPTVSPIISASMGLFVPFFIFVVALFVHFYSIWTTENSAPSATARVRAAFVAPRFAAARPRPQGFFQRASPVRSLHGVR